MGEAQVQRILTVLLDIDAGVLRACLSKKHRVRSMHCQDKREFAWYNVRSCNQQELKNA